MTETDQLERARHWLSVRNPQRCLDELGRIESGRFDTDFFRLRTVALINLQRCNEAVDSARRGLALDPDDLHLIDLLAFSLEEIGEETEAERLLLHGLSVDPGDVTLLASYAELLTRFHKLDKADRIIDRAMSIDAESTDVRLARMQWCYAKGRNRESIAWARKVLAEDPENPRALAFSGAVQNERGDSRTGSASMRKAAVNLLGNKDIAAGARASTIEAHPLMWPVRAMRRLPQPLVLLSGPAMVLLSNLLHSLGAPVLGFGVLIAWLVFVLYYWGAIGVAHLVLKRRSR